MSNVYKNSDNNRNQLVFTIRYHSDSVLCDIFFIIEIISLINTNKMIIFLMTLFSSYVLNCFKIFFNYDFAVFV